MALQQTACAAALDATAGSSHGSSVSQGTSLADVPAVVMSLILRQLHAADLARLSCVCRGLRATSWEAVPGLRLTLYPHQRNALSWMLHREVHGGAGMAHPFLTKMLTTSGLPYFINKVTGELSLDPPQPTRDIKGGFFCDEPGLGKTVTALALILKTQGLTPQIPKGTQATWLRIPEPCGPLWVMCDHCNKWRSLPPGHQVASDDPDVPWFCCLHPNPDLASCLASEELHEANSKKSNGHSNPVSGSYRNCPGFISASSPGDGDVNDNLYDSNVAHFTTVLQSVQHVAGSAELEDVLLWLSQQPPDMLVTTGVTVPRHLRKAAPGYGESGRSVGRKYA
eukprot:gene9276-9441_t